MADGLAVTLGSQQEHTTWDQSDSVQSEAKSLIGSQYGSVHITAGETVDISGSQIVTRTAQEILDPDAWQASYTAALTNDPGLALNNRNVEITGKTVKVDSGADGQTVDTTTEYQQSGLTLAISSPVVSAINTVTGVAQAASQSGDSRVAALAGATAALAIKNALDAVAQTPSGATASSVGGINISLSLGSSQSQSESHSESLTRFGSEIDAAGDVKITAQGGGAASDITVTGGQITAGHDVILTADDAILLQAGQSTASQEGSHSNSGGSIGISLGSQTGVTFSAYGGQGNYSGADSQWQNSHVTAMSSSCVGKAPKARPFPLAV